MIDLTGTDLENMHKQIQRANIKLIGFTLNEEELLFNLYKKLKESGDLERVIPKELRTLHGFLSIIQPPAIAFYTTGKDGQINQFYWVNEISLPHKAHIGMWVDRSMRGSKTFALTWCTIFEVMFIFIKTLVASMSDHTTQNLYKKIGAVVGMGIPEIWEGYDMCYMYLTKKMFNDSLFYKTYKKIWEKEK